MFKNITILCISLILNVFVGIPDALSMPITMSIEQRTIFPRNDLKGSYKSIMSDLLDNWESPISYLKSRGYLPNNDEFENDMDAIEKMEIEKDKANLCNTNIDEIIMLYKYNPSVKMEKRKRDQNEVCIANPKIIKSVKKIYDIQVDNKNQKCIDNEKNINENADSFPKYFPKTQTSEQFNVSAVDYEEAHPNLSVYQTDKETLNPNDDKTQSCSAKRPMDEMTYNVPDFHVENHIYPNKIHDNVQASMMRLNRPTQMMGSVKVDIPDVPHNPIYTNDQAILNGLAVDTTNLGSAVFLPNLPPPYILSTSDLKHGKVGILSSMKDKFLSLFTGKKKTLVSSYPTYPTYKYSLIPIDESDNTNPIRKSCNDVDGLKVLDADEKNDATGAGNLNNSINTDKDGKVSVENNKDDIRTVDHRDISEKKNEHEESGVVQGSKIQSIKNLKNYVGIVTVPKRTSNSAKNINNQLNQCKITEDKSIKEQNKETDTYDGQPENHVENQVLSIGK